MSFRKFCVYIGNQDAREIIRKKDFFFNNIRVLEKEDKKSVKEDITNSINSINQISEL